MDSYQQPLTSYEQRLRDEVIYLHSLWHRGPPPPPPPSIPLPNRYRPVSFPHHTNNPSRNLHVFNPTSFKKTNRISRQTLNARPSSSIPDPLPDPGPEWPVDPLPPTSPPGSSGWVSFEERPSVQTPKVSDIDDSKVAIVRMQQNVMNICNEFFAKRRADSDGEEDDEFFGEDGEDDSFDIEESEEFKFFFSLFVENRELRNFYENNHDSGGFYCLICGGVGKPGGKLFKDCQGLVQHANRILKTKRRRAHRCFGRAICRVLGWDISRLPTIVLTGKPLSQYLANLGETLNCLKEDDSKKVVEDIDNGACVAQESKVVDIVEGAPKENDDNGDEALELDKESNLKK